MAGDCGGLSGALGLVGRLLFGSVLLLLALPEVIVLDVDG